MVARVRVLLPPGSVRRRVCHRNLLVLLRCGSIFRDLKLRDLFVELGFGWTETGLRVRSEDVR
jgi:hypothetical protein